MRKLVFTGGHHTGAILVAKELAQKGWEVVWFGHRHSMWGDKADSGEYKEVTAAGFKFYDLKAGKFYRTFHPLKLLRIPWGFVQAFTWLVAERPVGIVSFGGYLAVPTVICGHLLGIPAITHEQTAVVGWANKLIAKFVRKIALSWPSSQVYYPAAKSEITGLPLRPEILSLRPNSRTSGTIYITGGKQGSHGLNEVVFKALPELTAKYTVIHQTGSASLFGDYQKAQDLASSKYQVFDFDSEKAIKAFEKADVVVGRSGAHTTYELGIMGKRSVLVPIPWVSHNEQEINARLLEQAGIAVVLLEKEMTPVTLLTSIDKAMVLAPKPMDLPKDATAKLVSLIERELG